jgi:hypothetical protein
MSGRHSSNSSGNKLIAYSGSDGETAEGDSYTQESEFLTERWSPGSVGTMHRFSDLDSSSFAQHHTLGPRHNQGSPGDHSHDGATSKNIGLWVPWSSDQTSWTAQTTNPAIGNGFIEGKYRKIGTDVRYRFSLTAGTLTTFGTGGWLFKIPFQAVLPKTGINAMAPAIGSCHGFQGGSANYTGAVIFFDNLHVMLASHAVANTWQSNTPVTWTASSSNLWGFQIDYESIS